MQWNDELSRENLYNYYIIIILKIKIWKFHLKCCQLVFFHLSKLFFHLDGRSTTNSSVTNALQSSSKANESNCYSPFTNHSVLLVAFTQMKSIICIKRAVAEALETIEPAAVMAHMYNQSIHIVASFIFSSQPWLWSLWSLVSTQCIHRRMSSVP